MMELPEYINLPEYFDHYDNAFKIVEAPGGGLRGYVLARWTGEFRVANSLLRKVLFGMGEDISPASEAEFVELTEESRSHYLRGEGPIFAIYKTIDDWFDQRDSLDKAMWRSKRDFISELRRRTFVMWEEEFARQAAGEPPSFEYRSIAGPIEEQKARQHVDPTPDLSEAEAAEWFRELGRMRANFDRAWNASNPGSS